MGTCHEDRDHAARQRKLDARMELRVLALMQGAKTPRNAADDFANEVMRDAHNLSGELVNLADQYLRQREELDRLQNPTQPESRW